MPLSRSKNQFLAPQAVAQRSGATTKKQQLAQRCGSCRIASEARTSGTYTAPTEGAVPYEEINGLMGGKHA
jgi:hypothetical protein